MYGPTTGTTWYSTVFERSWRMKHRWLRSTSPHLLSCWRTQRWWEEQPQRRKVQNFQPSLQRKQKLTLVVLLQSNLHRTHALSFDSLFCRCGCHHCCGRGKNVDYLFVPQIAGSYRGSYFSKVGLLITEIAAAPSLSLHLSPFICLPACWLPKSLPLLVSLLHLSPFICLPACWLPKSLPLLVSLLHLSPFFCLPACWFPKSPFICLPSFVSLHAESQNHPSSFVFSFVCLPACWFPKSLPLHLSPFICFPACWFPKFPFFSCLPSFVSLHADYGICLPSFVSLHADYRNRCRS